MEFTILESGIRVSVTFVQPAIESFISAKKHNF